MSFEDPSTNDSQSERRLQRVGTLEDEDEEELQPLESPINGRQSVPAPLPQFSSFLGSTAHFRTSK